jgi:hypothetical protein
VEHSRGAADATPDLVGGDGPGDRDRALADRLPAPAALGSARDPSACRTAPDRGPQLAAVETNVPAALSHAFVVAVTLTTLLSWTLLGGLAGSLYQRFAQAA